MTSRERVLAALNHKQPDRVPIDLSSHRSSGIAAIAYPKLRKYLGLEPKSIRVYDVIQELAIVDEDVLDLFNVDAIELGRGFALEDKDWKDWVLPDGTACLVPEWTNLERENNRWIIRSKSGKIIAHMPDGALYFEQTYFPFAENEDINAIPAALDECMWATVASPPGPVNDKELADGAKKLRENTDRAIIGLFGGNLFEIGQFLYRNDNFMMLLAAEPQRAHNFLDKLTELHMANLENYLSAVGEYIDVILFGDDLGMQAGPMMSTQMYQEFFKPRHKLLWNRAKELADVKVQLHCCGGIKPLIPELIEAGIDAINPVQISCVGMDAAELKAEFGKDITFWGGGCDTRGTLPNTTPKEIAEHVREQTKILSPGGGFVFQQVHNIMSNVPPENIVAMFNAAKETF